MLLATILLSIALGFGSGKIVYDKPVSYPTIKKPHGLQDLTIIDCMGSCDKEFTIKMTPRQRGEIDSFIRDCIRYENTTNKLVDSYNKITKEYYE